MKEKFEKLEKEQFETINSDPRRLQYHLMPPVGWLNDPNGLCQKDGIYHIFYQYSPDDPDGKTKCWGHYSSKDLKHFKQEDIALYPDSEMDKDGAYSGSAFIKDGTIHFFYTGNIKFPGNYDYIYEGRGHYVNGFESQDGFTFTNKHTILKNADYPSDMSCHVRDPKIYEEDGIFYMVLGGRDRHDKGMILIFESADLQNWAFKEKITTPYDFGYMWECPDLFKIDDQLVLITCPQGVDQDGYKFENVYQNGYFKVEGTLKDGIRLGEFTELDPGFDFYAPQSFEDEKNRRILFGWMGIPDADYTNPTVQRGWQHALTLPRELHFKNGKLYQYPVKEVLSLKADCEKMASEPGKLYSVNEAAYICLDKLPDEFVINYRNDCQMAYKDGLFTFSLGQSGYGRSVRHIEAKKIHSLEIFSDNSSIELFLNKGEYALTSRIYDETGKPSLSIDQECELTICKMNPYQIDWKQ